MPAQHEHDRDDDLLGASLSRPSRDQFTASAEQRWRANWKAAAKWYRREWRHLKSRDVHHVREIGNLRAEIAQLQAQLAQERKGK